MLEGKIKDDGTTIDAWFDEQRLTTNPKATSGGDRTAPPARPNCG